MNIKVEFSFEVVGAEFTEARECQTLWLATGHMELTGLHPKSQWERDLFAKVS
jgi:hypothetical protein